MNGANTQAPIAKFINIVMNDQSGGKLALCFAPGKVDRCIKRDLKADLAELHSLGYHVIANLLDSFELRKYHLPPLPSSRAPHPSASARHASSGRVQPPAPALTYPAIAAAAGLEVLSYPGGIPEMLAPGSVAPCHAFLQTLLARLRAGQSIVMHCRAGVGRAGMMAAMLLALAGQAATAAEAIAVVRVRRCPQAVESRAQEQFIARYVAFLEESRLRPYAADARHA